MDWIARIPLNRLRLVVLSFGLMAFLVHVANRPLLAQEQPRNVILFISDGCGPASFTMARDYLRVMEKETSLALDAHLVGSLRTFASNSRVTDSAASATAYACGVKTYNGAIGVDTLQRPVATLLEAAEAKGLATGLVATSRISHATPAAFSAHVTSRSEENAIAVQQVDQGIEVILGGGRQHYLPASEEGRREDGRNLMDEAAANGYQVATDREGFDALNQVPAIGLFSDSHMDFEIDRDPAAQPSLAEMTQKAIDLLQGDPDGFFLMVEGSRIDHAGHGNDPAAHLHDILAFDEAVAAALAFSDVDGATLVLSTSDHETGGLTLGRDGVYEWNPEVLARVTRSQLRMVYALVRDRLPIAEVMRDMAGIDDLTAEEVAEIEGALATPQQLNGVLSEVISRRALVGWTSIGHTAVDVNLYAFGPGQDQFVGNRDNTYLGIAIARLLGLDLAAQTSALQQDLVGSSR